MKFILKIKIHKDFFDFFNIKLLEKKLFISFSNYSIMEKRDDSKFESKTNVYNNCKRNKNDENAI